MACKQSSVDEVASSPSLIRFAYMKHIDQHPYLSKGTKAIVKQLISKHFALIGEIIGNLELVERRASQVEEDITL